MRDTWTSADGTAHFIDHGRTLCDLTVAPNTAHAITGCTACVRASIDDYARWHECGATCRV